MMRTRRNTPRRSQWLRMIIGVSLLILLSGFAAEAGETEMLSVDTKELNFRLGPSKEHDIVFVASRFYPVKVLKRKDQWIYAEDFEGERAWVAGWLLSKQDAVVIRAKTASIRNKPEPKAEVVELVDRGVAFKVIKRTGDWVQVADEESTVGWIVQNEVWGGKL